VTPAATAQLLVKRLHHMLILSAGIGVFSGIVGLYASFHLDAASGASIVLTSTVLFILAFSAAQLRQTLGHWWAARQQARAQAEPV
jgi:ABC-type Mn2+/Zn2+ transport system permease subunit